MIIWQEFSAHSVVISFEDIINLICCLPNYNSNWSLSGEKTIEFTEHLGEVAGVLINNKASAFFCISSKDQQTVHLSNIFLISETPRGKPRGFLAQLEYKLRRPLL